MSAFLKGPAARTSAMAAVGAVAAYSGYSYSQRKAFLPTAHAEGPKKTFASSGFIELKLEHAEMVNHNVKKLTFALPEPDSVSGLGVVSSLLSWHTPEGALLPVIRPYTPVSENDEAGHVTFMVKKYPNGKGSGKMHSLVPGDTLKFKSLHEFDYKPNAYSAMTFIAGGSGITPIYQLTRAILRNPSDQTKVNLVYANNTEQDILLKSEFDELEREYPGRFKATYTISGGESNESEGMFHKGYVTRELLQKTMPDRRDLKNVKVLVSGPPPMTAFVAGAKGMAGWTQGSLGGILKEMGYQSTEVHKF